MTTDPTWARATFESGGPLTEGERMIWAAAYAAALWQVGPSAVQVAAHRANGAVLSLRRARLDAYLEDDSWARQMLGDGQ